MDELLQQTILQVYPQAAKIIDIQSFRPGYMPYPARLTLQTTSGDTVICVLNVRALPNRLEFEAQVLRALADLGLPVPQILADPVLMPAIPEPLTVMLISEMPGQPIPWMGLTDLATANQTCHLVHAAVERLHSLTPAIMAHPIASLIPSRTLEAEVQTIRAHQSDWLDVPMFNEALSLVESAIPRYRSPLVFSNGDYNPLNFLVADDALVGWIDFENACFEDPTIGFAKFLLWADDDGWSAGSKVGLVERFLYRHQVAPAAFLLRLVLRGLSHLQDTSPADPPRYTLQAVANAVEQLRQALDM